jgi:hypothetical protein
MHIKTILHTVHELKEEIEAAVIESLLTLWAE